MIKNNRPSKKSKYKQGYFPINECQKYVGKTPIIYRSSWERKFCIYCENTPQIINWSSEPCEIKYFHPINQKYHRYYPDFLIKMDNGQIFLIEIKPQHQLEDPILPKRKTKKAMINFHKAKETWLMNMAKFDAANKFCENNNWKFKIITEKFFK